MIIIYYDVEQTINIREKNYTCIINIPNKNIQCMKCPLWDCKFGNVGYVFLLMKPIKFPYPSNHFL